MLFTDAIGMPPALLRAEQMTGQGELCGGHVVDVAGDGDSCRGTVARRVGVVQHTTRAAANTDSCVCGIGR